MTRDQFMDAFRNNWDEINEGMSGDDCVEVFSSVLKGESDLTWQLFDEVCSNYGVDFSDVVTSYLKTKKGN